MKRTTPIPSYYEMTHLLRHLRRREQCARTQANRLERIGCVKMAAHTRLRAETLGRRAELWDVAIREWKGWKGYHT